MKNQIKTKTYDSSNKNIISIKENGDVVLPQATVIKSVYDCSHDYYMGDSINNMLICRKCGQTAQKKQNVKKDNCTCTIPLIYSALSTECLRCKGQC